MKTVPKPDWRDHAACRGTTDPEMFFPVSERDTDRIAAAQQVCRQCPVIEHCLSEALEHSHDHGIFGGHTPEQRRALRIQECAATAETAAQKDTKEC